MPRLILKKLLLAIPLLLLISVLVFLMIHMLPGDPIEVIFGKNPNPGQIALIQQQYHLDKPLPVQYWLWLTSFLRGDWGKSFSQNTAVTGLVFQRLARTGVLCVLSIVISLLLAIPAGIKSAVRHNTMTDLALSSLSLVMLSVPGFFVGVLLILLFSVQLGWLPASGFVSPSASVPGWLRSLIMPAGTLGIVLCAYTMRYVRSNVLETMGLDYVMLARAKGNNERRVLYIHTLRNALIPVITQIGMQMGSLLGGEIVIEKVFAYPGLGLLMINALYARDYPLIQGCIMVFATLVIIINIAVDIVYTLIDPRISYGKK